MSGEIVFAEKELTEKIIRVFFQVYNELGSGFMEIVYARAMAIALAQVGLQTESEVPISVTFRGQTVGVFRADLLVNKAVILEFKATEQIIKAHEAQLTHYLRSSSYEVGLIFNFGETPRFRRVEYLNHRKSRLQWRCDSP